MVGEIVEIVEGDEVHKRLLKGSNAAASAVATTFGPYGRNVAITMRYNVPRVTKDGATVAGYIKLRDPVQNVAAQLINQAANETAKVAGDGTTSTSILTANLVREAFDLIDKGGQTMQIKRDLEACLPKTLTALENLSKEVTKKDVYNIALVACNNDTEMAQIVTDAFKIVGEAGLVTVTDSKGYDTTLDATDGIRLDRTHILPALSNGNTSVKHTGANIAVLDLDITTAAEAVYLLELQEQTKKPLLIICNDLTGSAAEVISFNKTKYNMPVEVIRAPFIADARKAACIDLACVANATLIKGSEGWTASDITEENLGSCDSFEVTQRETNIIGRHGDKDLIAERVSYYEEKISADMDGLADNYKKRLAFFTSGAAVVYVGGVNETEVDEKKDRFDDTIRAVRSALEEGFVDGGGLTYHTLAKVVRTNHDTPASTILADSLEGIVERILKNSGIVGLQSHFMNVGANNIIDPTLVVKSTVVNAIGAAIMIFTTDCVIIRNED